MRKSPYFLTLLISLIGYHMMPGRASSHREAPLISNDPQADNTDVYAFVSPDRPDTVTLIACYSPFENPQGGPNFYRFGDNVLYEIRIDNTGDAVEDVTFRWRFTTQVRNAETFLYNTGPIRSPDDANRNVVQTYTLTRLDRGVTTFVAGPMHTMPDNVGTASTPGYGSSGSGIYQFAQPGGTIGAVFAGQTDDPFFLDLRVFDLLYGGDLSETGTDSLAGYNVHAVALQVPKTTLRSALNPIIGVWATASRPATTTRQSGSETSTGSFVQVSRLGMPLVNEVVLPLSQKDKWNGSAPADDAQFLQYVTSPEVPVLLNLLFGLQVPATPRSDLVQVFLTGVPGLNQPPGVKPSEMIRLNTDILPTANPLRLGVLSADVQGFPNGRRLTDDVIDITLQAAAGILTGANVSTLGDGVDRNDVGFRSTFPYLAFPQSGSLPRKLNPDPPQG